jgi:hypothetical protein
MYRRCPMKDVFGAGSARHRATRIGFRPLVKLLLSGNPGESQDGQLPYSGVHSEPQHLPEVAT